ncbi:Nitroreductase [[Clostridium] polysaccharolyticum]|uniref:Nitroreductase n=2 Tax=[Clostridium] polysaccharolyticum TaxID=29364 RepID=A0A1I0B9R2_9FIRM|nr:Nitroreductase [[Clostridium] polysaccharolyticum]
MIRIGKGVEKRMKLDIMESMKVRHSVRTYQKKDIPEELLQEIRAFLDSLQNKEQSKVKIKLVKQELGDKSVKLGTYGVIKGASYFFAGVCENIKEGYRNLGYVMEKAVLFCTSLGLGTCWIGGTFNKGNFAKVIELAGNEVIGSVSPLGWEAEKNSWLGNIMSQKGKRKEFEVNSISIWMLSV